MFIQEKRNRLVWRVTLGISAGILLGGAAANVENRACAKLETPPGQCLTGTPRIRIANGMFSGAFASSGALLMIELLGKSQKLD
jgi:hypothetical protein